MIISTGIKKLTKIKYVDSLLYIFHCDMLLLAVLDTISKESDELKSLENRSKLFIDPILEDIEKEEITVCILLRGFFFFFGLFLQSL